jgi:hypothetical protein
VFPDPQGLVQEVIENKQRQLMPVLPRAFFHFTKTALVAEKDEETNQYKRSVKKVGIDPHFSYANMLCDVAWSRSHGTATFIIPEGGSHVADMRNKAESMNMHGLPTNVTSMLEELPPGVCGRCSAFDSETGMCADRRLVVGPKDPQCVLFVARK